MELTAITYAALGQSFTGYLADGSNGKDAPGILVAHEGGGLGRHAIERAEMLAALGYVAFAMDMFGETNLTLDRAKEVVSTLRADPTTLRARMRAALDVLISHPHVDRAKLAAIGFCFGGTACLELARDGAPLAATVGFHSGLSTKDSDGPNKIKGKVLVCLGKEDPIIGAESRKAFMEEMGAANVDWLMHVYDGAGHSFTNREIDALNIPGFAYNEDADQKSWAAMREVFAIAFR